MEKLLEKIEALLAEARASRDVSPLPVVQTCITKHVASLVEIRAMVQPLADAQADRDFLAALATDPNK